MQEEEEEAMQGRTAGEGMRPDSEVGRDMVAAVVDLRHITVDEFDKLMNEAIGEIEVKQHHAAKVLLHLVTLHGDGVRVIDVCKTEEDMQELKEFMFQAMERHDLKRPDVEIFQVHKLQVSELA